MQIPDSTDFTRNSRGLLSLPGAGDATIFDRTTLARRVGADRFELTLEHSWDVLRGPNGGYLAGLLLRTMTRRLDDGGRTPRVLTVHYPEPAVAGPAEIHTRLIRKGRSVAWVGAELFQQGRLRAVAHTAFSPDWDGVAYAVRRPPQVPAPEAALPPPALGMPPFTRHFEYGSTFGQPMVPGQSDAVGGYIRPVERRPYDRPLLAALTDAWFPSTLAHDGRFVLGSTLDLTVHFRDRAALEALSPDDRILSVFRSRLASEGFFEEDGELWSPDGRLLAQSRQLAVGLPLGG